MRQLEFYAPKDPDSFPSDSSLLNMSFREQISCLADWVNFNFEEGLSQPEPYPGAGDYSIHQAGRAADEFLSRFAFMPDRVLDAMYHEGIEKEGYLAPRSWRLKRNQRRGVYGKGGVEDWRKQISEQLDRLQATVDAIKLQQGAAGDNNPPELPDNIALSNQELVQIEHAITHTRSDLRTQPQRDVIRERSGKLAFFATKLSNWVAAKSFAEGAMKAAGAIWLTSHYEQLAEMLRATAKLMLEWAHWIKT